MKTEVGRSLTAIAKLLDSTGKTDGAVKTYRQSESLLAGLAGSDPSARAALADCRWGLGNLLAKTGKYAGALAVYKLARVDQEALTAAPGASNVARRDALATTTSIATLLWQTGKPSGVRRPSSGAATLAPQQKLADENPEVPDFRNRQANNYYNLGIVLWQTGKPSEAVAEFRAAAAIQQKLVDDNQAVTDFRLRLANSHNGFLGGLLWQTGKPSEAEVEYRAALTLQQKLADDNPAVTNFRFRLALTHFNIGNLRWHSGAPSESEEAAYEAAASDPSEAGRRQPRRHRLGTHLALSHTNIANRLWQRGKPSEAAAEFRAALAVQQKLADDNPAVSEFRNYLASSHTDRSDMLRRLGRPTEARDALERAIAIREVLVKQVPGITMFRSHLAWSYRRRGLALRDLGDAAGAAADTRRAMALWDGLPSRIGRGAVRDRLLPRSGWPARPVNLARACRPTKLEARPRGRWPCSARRSAMGFRDASSFPHRGRPRASPVPRRLQAVADGPGDAGRPVRRRAPGRPTWNPGCRDPPTISASNQRM